MNDMSVCVNLTDGDNQGPTVTESGEIHLGTDDSDHETDDENGPGSDFGNARMIVIEMAC